MKHPSNLSVDPGVDNRDLGFKTSGTLSEDQLLGRIHLNNWGKNIFADRLANLVRRALN